MNRFLDIASDVSAFALLIAAFLAIWIAVP
jgi:hypothetical protein